MVLTITLNPLLERRLVYEKIQAGAVNRPVNEYFTAGGKGINVSRQLGRLGIKNSAITFLGGGNGKILRSLLAEEKIDATFVSTKGETRHASLCLDKSKEVLTTYFGMNTHVSGAEADDMKARLEKAITNCSIVILSGSSPCPETDSVFPAAIELANKHDKISILDTYGNHLKACIDAGPTVMHNNARELSSSLGLDLSGEEAKLKLFKELYCKGVRMAYITDGASPVYASKFDFHYKALVPPVEEKDPCGSGDSFTAGIAYGLEESLIFDHSLMTACALGSANAASWETSAVAFEQMKKFYDKVEVLPIGKKMKIIDDRPTI